MIFNAYRVSKWDPAPKSINRPGYKDGHVCVCVCAWLVCLIEMAKGAGCDSRHIQALNVWTCEKKNSAATLCLWTDSICCCWDFVQTLPHHRHQSWRRARSVKRVRRRNVKFRRQYQKRELVLQKRLQVLQQVCFSLRGIFIRPFWAATKPSKMPRDWRISWSSGKNMCARRCCLKIRCSLRTTRLFTTVRSSLWIWCGSVPRWVDQNFWARTYIITSTWSSHSWIRFPRSSVPYLLFIMASWPSLRFYSNRDSYTGISDTARKQIKNTVCRYLTKENVQPLLWWSLP